MDLHEALTQISAIRAQVARTETFRGYRSLPVAISGVIACLAAGFQDVLIPEPAKNLTAYFIWWNSGALLSMAITGVAMVLHCKRSPSSLTVPNTILAVGQFLPCVVAGGLVPFVIIQTDAAWMLPGLWAIFFSLGIFASYRLLPKATFWVGVFYMTTGIMCLLWARGDFAFSAWAMGVPFGVGQLLSAAILYWTLERRIDEQEKTDL